MNKKIGIVIDRLNVGGVEKIAIEQVKSLRKMGTDAHLVILREKAVVENAFSDLLEDVPIVYLDKRLPRVFKLSFQLPMFHFFSSFHLTYALFLPFVIKKGEFDYLIAHGTYTTLSTISIQKIKKIPTSAFIWDPAIYILDRVYGNQTKGLVKKTLRFMATRFDRYIINHIKTVLVGGVAHNDYIHSINSSKPIRVIYPSVHPVKNILKKEDYALMATAWKRGKNPEYVIEIVKAKPDIKIKMVGKWLDADYRSEFQALIDDNKLSSQIKLVGEVSEKEMSDYLSRALVVLQTNDDRGFGMPALEAAGAGTTFIIPKDQGVCSLFDDGKDGFYTTEKDTESIVSLLDKITNDKKLASVMGKRAWTKVVNNYSWEKHALEIIKVVQP